MNFLFSLFSLFFVVIFLSFSLSFFSFSRLLFLTVRSEKEKTNERALFWFFENTFPFGFPFVLFFFIFFDLLWWIFGIEESKAYFLSKYPSLYLLSQDLNKSQIVLRKTRMEEAFSFSFSFFVFLFFFFFLLFFVPKFFSSFLFFRFFPLSFNLFSSVFFFFCFLSFERSFVFSVPFLLVHYLNFDCQNL